MRVLRSQTKRIGVDRAIFFPWHMLGRARGQTIESCDEMKWRRRPWQPVSFHQLFCQQQIANRWQNRHEQNSDGGLTLVKQTSHESEGAIDVPLCKRVAQLENYASTRK